MLGGHRGRFAAGGGDDATSCQVIGFAKEAAGPLVDGGHRRFIKKHPIRPGDGEMVAQIILHHFLIDPLEMAASHDAAGQRLAGAIVQLVNQINLSCQNDREKGFGILLKLGQRRPRGRKTKGTFYFLPVKKNIYLCKINRLKL